MKHRLLHAEDGAGLSSRAADLLLDRAAAAICRKGIFNLAISGGSTPRRLFSLLGGELARQFPAAQTRVFWCDERCVPPDHSWSNFGLARRLWFAPAAYPPENIHPVPTELPRDRAAEKYEEIIRTYLTNTPLHPRHGPGDSPGGNSLETLKKATNDPGDRPVASFDLCLLGMGSDGHVASLFPGSSAPVEDKRWVVGTRPPEYARPPVDRVTLTFEALRRAHTAVVMVAGEQKAALVERILAGEAEVANLPAARVRAREEIYWLVGASVD